MEYREYRQPSEGPHWSLVIGHWSLVIGHWSLVIGHGSWVMGHGSWVMGHGSWVMGHGSWVMGHGSWVMGHGEAYATHGPVRTRLEPRPSRACVVARPSLPNRPQARQYLCHPERSEGSRATDT